MPLIICYAFGYVIACMSPSVGVPELIKLYDRGYGRKDGIISAMITGGSLDNILGVIVFGVIINIAVI